MGYAILGSMTTWPSYPIITPFEVTPTAIDGLYIITMKQVTDERGTVRELFRQSAMDSTPLPQFGPWKQINATQTNRGSIRGLHAEAMNKLVAVVAGEAFGVYVDARIDSPTVGAVVTVPLTKGVQVFVPQGVCNGFQSTSEQPSQYLYCFDEEWQPGMPGISLTPLDPELGIDWPIPIDTSTYDQVSKKDGSAPTLRSVIGDDAMAQRTH